MYDPEKETGEMQWENPDDEGGLGIGYDEEDDEEGEIGVFAEGSAISWKQSAQREDGRSVKVSQSVEILVIPSSLALPSLPVSFIISPFPFK